MIQDAHSAKISIPVSAGPGEEVVIPAHVDAWIYIHELIGDLNVTGTLTVLCGAVIKGTWNLDAGQGITLGDEPGNDGVPRFECKPGENFTLALSAGSTFTGSVDYSLRF